jgi:hypothetical protein
MKPDRSRIIALVLGATLPLTGIGSVLAAGDVLTTGDIATMSQWYGRAGELVGAQRIEAISKSTSAKEQVGIAYDKDVAARTNMPRESASNSQVAITYDKDVAERTNMPRGEKGEATKSAGVSAKPAN